MRYEKYKQTGTKWITFIPVSWDMQKIGALFVQRKEKVSDKDFAPISVTKNGILPQLATAAKTDDGDNRKKVCVGDFVINSRSDRKGSCGVSDLEGSVSLINIVLQPREQLNGKYAHYLLRNHLFSEEYYRNGRGIVADLWTTRYSEMKTILLPVPPRAEQDQIVRYLDWQVSKINRLIAAKRKQIALMRDNLKSAVAYYTTHGLGNHELCQSEIYWLTHYPNDWRVTKLRYIMEKHRREVTPNAELLICSNSGEVVKRGDGKLGLVASSDDIYQGVTAGDLLIHGMDTWHGAIAISSFDGMCTPVVHVCTCKEEKRYVAYYLKMMAYTKVFKAISNGVRQNTSDFRSWDKVGDLLICLPTHDEQVAIADKLDYLTVQTKAGISFFEKQIEHLQELRTRLISDVVTGQVDVRGIEVPEFEYVGEADVAEEQDEEAEEEIDG